MGTDRHSPRAVCQVTDDDQSPVGSPETESLEDIISKLFPTPSRPPPEAAPIPSDQDLLIQQLMGSDTSITAGGAGTIEIDRFGDVTELAFRSEQSLADPLEGCFSCGGFDPHNG